MICYLSGTLLTCSPQSVELLTSSGIGYEIHINEKIHAEHFDKENSHFFVYHHRTENSENLFGFTTRDEKKLFTELIKISGVGGKVAMQILSLGVTRLLEAVAQDDLKTIQQIKGVGKKMSEKIVLELKDKDLGIVLSSTEAEKVQASSAVISSELSTTLKHMGYTPEAIERAFAKLPEGLNDAGEILPLLIKELS